MKISIRTKLIVLLFALISLSIGLISLQAYKVALLDMSSNAKEITRIYAKNISKLIEERLQTVKDKTFYIANNSINNSVVFEKAPEILAVFIFSIKNEKIFTTNLIINQNYKNKYAIDDDFFKNIPSDINFNLTISNQEYLNVSNLEEPISEVIVYSYTGNEVNTKTIYTAVIIPDIILTAISSDQSTYINYLVDSNNKILAHSDSSQSGRVLNNVVLFDNFFKDTIVNERTMEYVDEKNENVLGSVFRIKSSNLGVVSKILSKDAYAEAQKLKMILIFSTVIVLFISLLFSIFFGKTITDPILKLSNLTDEIASGNFLVNIDINHKDEIGQLANSFKHMGMELHKREETLKETQAQLVQSEKMSAFGQLGAGIAHEVKNPLAGILGHAELAYEKISKCPDSSDIQKNLEVIQKETKRCKNIIENLLRFARREKEILKLGNIEHTINDAIDLVDHQLSINGIKIIKSLNSNIPQVLINNNQIEQVLMNLMLNAQHAMLNSDEKLLTINLKTDNKFVIIEIIDTGKGISDTVKNKIFEPFFTTKPAGQGTGLGLSVSYGIIKDHKGEIILDSKEGKGTKFTILIPLPSNEEILLAKDSNNIKNELIVPDFNLKNNSYRGADPIISKEYVPKFNKIKFEKDLKIKRPERKNKA